MTSDYNNNDYDWIKELLDYPQQLEERDARAVESSPPTARLCLFQPCDTRQPWRQLSALPRSD